MSNAEASNDERMTKAGMSNDELVQERFGFRHSAFVI
jgi:hypothetical protein